MREVRSLESLPRPLNIEEQKGRSPCRFGWVVLLFFSPIILMVALIETVLWQTAETWPITRVIAQQRTAPQRLFMRGLLDQGFFRYKSLQFEEKKPKVLVLGSSRVMEFRAEMFGVRSNEFFNAGGLIQDLSDLQTLAEGLKDPPEIIILGIDFWWFNGNKPLANGLALGRAREAALDWQEHVRVLRKFKSSKARKPAWAAWRARSEDIGIEARTAGVGFRGDGSMRYNFPEPDAEWKFVDHEKPPIAERIRNSSAQFTPSSGLSEERVQLLEKALETLVKRNVLVLGFLPPVSSEAGRLLDASAVHSELWRKVRVRIPQVFRSVGMPFVDASRTDDLLLVDGIHAAETFHLHLLKSFLENERVRQAFSGLDVLLSRSLASKKTNPWHPDYEPFFEAGP